ncbi:tape measure protein [Geomicrobium sp. JSM 1781026]|uniref:tape measure protein n=1 Tax=Geomicrobium sp. JSM 1781026 TaxID=3344580 RepID=UPI0035C133E7
MADELSSASGIVQDATGNMISTNVSKDFSDAAGSLNDFAGASDNVKGSAGGIAGMLDAARDSAHQLRDAFNEIPKLNDKIGDFGKDATVSFAPVTGFFGAALGGGVNRMIQMEQAENMISQMVGEGAAFERVMGNVKDLADDTSYLYSEVASMMGSTLGFGASEQDAQLFANVAMELGAFKGDKELAGRINEMFGQALTRGTIDGNLTNRLAESGIETWEIIGEALGTGADEAAEMVNSGAIPMEEALRHLSDGIMDDFEGSMIKYAESLPGLISNTWAALGNLGQEMIGADGFELLKESMQGMIDTLYELVPIFEPIGSQIMTVLADVADAASDFLDWILDLPAPVQSALAYFALFLGAIGPIALAFHAVVKAGLLVGKMFMMLGKTVLAFGKAFLWLSRLLLLNPIGLVVTAIVGLVAGIIWLVRNFDMVKEKVSDVWTALMVFLSALRDGDGVLAVFAGAIQDYLKFALEQAQIFWEYLKDVFALGVDFFKALFSGDFAEAFEILGEIWERTKEVAAELWANLRDTIQDIADEIGPYVERAFELMKEKVVEWITQLVLDGVAKFMEFYNDAKQWASDLVTAVVQYFADLKDDVIDFVLQLKDGAVEKFDELRDGAIGAMDTFKSKVSTVWTSIRNTFTNGVNHVIRMVNRMIGGLNNFSVDLPRILGGGTIGFDIPLISEIGGGTYNAGVIGAGGVTPSRAYHGENFVPYNNKPYLLHRGEKVLNRQEADAYRRGQSGATVSFPNAVFHVREEADIDKIGRAVAKNVIESTRGGALAHGR